MTTSARASARALRLAALAVLTVAVALAVSVGLAPRADAAAYRFWSYWQSPSGVWAFSQAGPGAVLPADGSVEGWRFAVTTEAGTSDAAPRVEPSFDALCGATPAQDGMKRVGLVVDFGEPSHAPDGETPPETVATCAVVPADANGYAVLSAAGPTRTEAGLVCAIAGYPAHECATVVDDSALASASDAAISTDTAVSADADTGTDTAADTDANGGFPTGVVVSVVVVAFIVVLGAAARRRRAS